MMTLLLFLLASLLKLDTLLNLRNTDFFGQIKNLAWADPNHGIKIDIDLLKLIFENPEIAHLPVVLLSVNGVTRQGKSFILNQFLKYLSGNSTAQENWLFRELVTCFNVGYTSDSCTEGIQVWSEPFVLSNPENQNEKLAVVLIDNQGSGGMNSNTNEESKIDLFSSLLSSLFIFFKTSEGRKYLETLDDIVSYSAALQAETENDAQKFRLGHLLIRFSDFRWTNEFAMPKGCSIYNADNTEGHLPEQDLFQKVFTMASCNSSPQAKILETYDHITLATTARFGEEPNSLSPQLGDGNEKFWNGLITFVEHALSFPVLWKSCKTINGQVLRAHELLPFIDKWAQEMMKLDYNVNSLTSYKANVQIYFDGVIKKSIQFYREEFAKFKTNPDKPFEEFLMQVIAMIENDFWNRAYHNEKKRHWEEFQNHMDPLITADVDIITSLQKQKEMAEKLVRTQAEQDMLKIELKNTKREQEKINAELRKSKEEQDNLNLVLQITAEEQNVLTNELRKSKEEQAGLKVAVKTAAEEQESLKNANYELTQEQQKLSYKLKHSSEQHEKIKAELDKLKNKETGQTFDRALAVGRTMLDAGLAVASYTKENAASKNTAALANIATEMARLRDEKARSHGASTSDSGISDAVKFVGTVTQLAQTVAPIVQNYLK